ncbi:MAG: IS200/IS605 family transposase [Thermodesulfovibrionales bacterium]
MDSYQSLAQTRYDCKYHIVFVPKFRKKTLFGKIRKYLKGVFHELAKQRGCEIISGHRAADHVHMCISIPPKYAVSEVIGYMKGKSAIAVARQFAGKQQNFSGENLWARGYAVSTVGFDLEKVKDYIAHQEKLETEQEAGRF